MDKVNVGVIPIIDVAAIYLGDKKGFFKDEKIDLHLQQAESGSAIISEVMSGQTQFGFSSVVGMMIATSKGLPIKAVTPGLSSTGVKNKDFGMLVVPKDSPIKSPADLEGKRIGTNALDNICTVADNASIRKAGGDPSKAKYVEIPVPETVDNLENGNVDAACLTEPFLTPYLKSDGRVLATNYLDIAPKATISAYFTTEQLEKKDPDLVKRFTAAMEKSLDYADAHPDEVRAIVPTYTDIDAPAMKDAIVPAFPSSFDSSVTSTIDAIADDAKLDGVIPKDYDPSTMLP